MRVSIIAAVADNGVIGKDNDLAWHLPDDMEFFKSSTLGRTVVMGRKNYESIPSRYRPLPRRTNIVVSRNTAYDAPGCLLATGLNEALLMAAERGETHTYIIGGGEIYRQALLHNLANDMYVTHVHHHVDGDTYFPPVDHAVWQGETLLEKPSDDRHPYAFTIMRYSKRAQDSAK